jgi:hypothetical protein
VGLRRKESSFLLLFGTCFAALDMVNAIAAALHFTQGCFMIRFPGRTCFQTPDALF